MALQAKIDELIEQAESFELVRDQIGLILLTESARQQQLAHKAGRNPEDWKLRVFTEASNPWDEFGGAASSEDEPAEPLDTTPLVNIAWDGSSFDGARGNPVEYQNGTATFHVDVYGCGRSRLTTDGHAPGDQKAAFEAQRAVRLVRKILMSAHWLTLGLTGIVGRRWVQTIHAFQPQEANRQVDHVQAARIAFAVDVKESAPQVAGEILERISIQVFRKETGELYMRADFPQPTPEE